MQYRGRARRANEDLGQLVARAFVLVALALVLGACSATPISIPNGADGGLPVRDMGVAADAGGRDLAFPDSGPTPHQDAGPQPDAARSDTLTDAPGEAGPAGDLGDGGTDATFDLGTDDDGTHDATSDAATMHDSTAADAATSTGG